jgi:thioesterase domain-containing protein/NAD(P)-dependent dehydrogenase (short-subunit alcohol dehydrogenase family)/acyl carrier protein
MSAVATLFTRGHTIDWDALFAPADPRRVTLPTYPFQRERYWLDWAPARTVSTAPDCYAEAWRPVTPAPAPTGRWVVVWSAENPLVSTVVATMAEQMDITVLSSDVFAEQVGSLGPVAGVLSLVGLGEEPVAATVALAQTLAGLPLPVWWITRGAVAGDGAAPAEPDQAQLWGFGRVFALECRVLGGGLIDLPDVVDAPVVEQLVGVLTSAEDQIAIRSAGPVARRLVRASRGTRAWQPRGTVLVTGGTGALGGHAARWAARGGAQHLVLLSRSGHASEDLLTDIRAAGAEVTVIPCDVTDRDALAAVLAEHPPTAVVHAAGVPSSGLIAELTPENLAEATAAKIDGARHLDELTGDLDAFVLFSSVASSWGSAGNAAYVMGNAALDGIALRRRAAGQPACAIAWGPWAGGGMADADSLDRFRRRGISPLDPVTSIQLMATAALGPEPQLTVAAIRPSPLITELPGVRRPEPQRAPEPAAFTGPTGRDRLLDLVRAEIAAVLGHPGADAIAPDRQLLELGFDSLTAVELRTRLDAATGLGLPTSVVFDHPSATALAEHLHGLLTESEQPPPVPGVSISSLYRDACAAGRFTEANALTAAAAALRPTFTDPLAMGEPIRLASGPDAPVVIGVPAASPLSGPYEFARIARHFDGVRDVWVLPLPGFIAGERLPASLDVLAEVIAGQVLRLADGRPFVLAGRSSGGVIAYDVAVRLEAWGRPAEGLVLLDSFEPGSDAADRMQPGLLRNLADRETMGGRLDDLRLTGMASYFGLLAQWEPRVLATRTLFVAAEGTGAPDEVAPTWSLPHDLVYVPGDHFSMTEEHAPRTAAAMQEWLSTNPPTTHGALT